MNNKIDRSQFIAKIPKININSQYGADSTLNCDCDNWGTEEQHYRFVNVRDEVGYPKKLENGRNQKEKRLMGQPHIKWDGCYVQVRIDLDHAMWFKHWPVAAELAAQGKIEDPTVIDWVHAEGAHRFMMDMIITKHNGKTTKIAQAMVKLGILTEQGNDFILTSELNDADVATEDSISMGAVISEALQEIMPNHVMEEDAILEQEIIDMEEALA